MTYHSAFSASAFETTVTIPTATVDGHTVVIDVEVAVEYSGGYYMPAKFSGHPDSWAPEEGEAPEVDRVIRLDNGKDAKRRLSPRTIRELADRCWDHQQAHADDYNGPED